MKPYFKTTESQSIFFFYFSWTWSSSYLWALTSIKIARRIEKFRYSNYFHSGGREKVFACQDVCFALPFEERYPSVQTNTSTLIMPVFSELNFLKWILLRLEIFNKRDELHQGISKALLCLSHFPKLSTVLLFQGFRWKVILALVRGIHYWFQGYQRFTEKYELVSIVHTSFVSHQQDLWADVVWCLKYLSKGNILDFHN